MKDAITLLGVISILISLMALGGCICGPDIPGKEIAYAFPETGAPESVASTYGNLPEAIYPESQEEDEVLKEENMSEYDRIFSLIKEAAEAEGLDYKLAVAISRLETGNWKSELFISSYNFGGLLGVGYYRYPSEEEGLKAYIRCLKWYRDNGMDAVDEMADTYCPGGTWAAKVKEIMKEL